MKKRLTVISSEEELAAVVEEFLKVKAASGLSERTLSDYKKHLDKFLLNAPSTLEAETLIPAVADYFAAIPCTSPARYNHPYEYLSCFFNYCIRTDRLAVNPLTYLGLSKKRDDGNVKPAAMEDIKKLLNSYDRRTYAGLRYYAMILLLLDTGIRTSEIVSLRNDDYDSKAKQIIVNKNIAKTRRQRVVYLSNETSRAIDKLLKVKPSSWEDWLFPSQDGTQLQTHSLSVEFQRRGKELGIKITPYQLRHSFATYFVENGGNIFALQSLMGHSDIRMTKRYAEVAEGAKRQAHAQASPLNMLYEKSSERLIKI